MIFSAKNEYGIPTWKLVLEGRKTVTRRLKPMPVGKVFAVQPAQGKKAVCKARVIDCINSFNHFYRNAEFLDDYRKHEAKLEGFNTWDGLMRWFEKHNINFADTYRIEFEVIK